MLHIQQINGLYKYVGKSRKYVEEYLLEHVDEDVLKKQMMEELFQRDYTIFDGD